MLKSIGRSSPGLKKIFGGTVSPPSLIRKTIYQVYLSRILIALVSAAMAAGVAFAGAAMRSAH
jgi:hypothetical protein